MAVLAETMSLDTKDGDLTRETGELETTDKMAGPLPQDPTHLVVSCEGHNGADLPHSSSVILTPSEDPKKVQVELRQAFRAQLSVSS